MKSLCITGSTQCHAQVVADILQQAGMSEPSPVKRNETIDLMFWHEQVLAVAGEDGGPVGAIAEPARLWEQLASDIFLANINTPVWGWADARSLWLLDFWLNFDARLNFVLVCESPQDMLARAILRDEERVSVELEMNEWQVAHQKLLRFHLRNPARSLLIDATDCSAHPRAFVEHCRHKWNISLSPEGESSTAPTQREPIALYLAQQICNNYPAAIGLQQEILASRSRLGTGPLSSDIGREAPTPLISAYRSLHMQAAKVDVLAASLRSVESMHAEAVASHTRVSADLQLLQAAFDELSSRFEEMVVSQTRLQQEHEDVLQQARKENELLLLQLLEIQEELEASLEESSTARALQITDQGRFLTAQEENELLHAQMQQVQDELARTFEHLQKVEQQLQTFKVRETAAVVRSAARDKTDPAGTSTTSQAAGRTGRDPANGAWAAPTPTASTTGQGELANESGGLWKWVTGLFKSPGQPPASLQYERVYLKREQVNPDYEHLWLRFENLQLDEMRWADFEFRLSCAQVGLGHFGRYPKLEFPEEFSKAPFENWFVEAYDDFGAKLELRFAIPETNEPESMDLAVWQRVSDHDRRFLASLIVSLPKILGDLSAAGVSIKRSWQDWCLMATEMGRVTALRARPAPARARVALRVATQAINTTRA